MVCNEVKMAAQLAESLSLACGIPHNTAKLIGKAVILHDIGKNFIPDFIRNKPGKLSHCEFEIMKTHTILGARILSRLGGEFGLISKNIAQFHHEYHNGKGYWLKSTNDLPSYVQIASICDVYCALVNTRVYKKAWPAREALNYIRNRSGEQFCPTLVKVFIPLMEDRFGKESTFSNLL